MGSLLRASATPVKTHGWAQRIYARLSSHGEDVDAINIRVILAVMLNQKRSCPVTGVRFLLVDKIPDGVPYHRWVTRLDPKSLCACPEAVRPDRSKPFALNNLVFVSEPVATLYNGLPRSADVIPGVSRVKSKSTFAVLKNFLDHHVKL